MQHKNNNAFFRQLLYLAVLIGIGIVIFTQLDFFIGAFLGALTIYVILRNSMFSLVEKHRWHRWIASLALVSATALVMIGFGYAVVAALNRELPNINMKTLIDDSNQLMSKVNQEAGMTLIPEDIIMKSDGIIQKAAVSIMNSAYSFTVNVFMMLIILYFMLSGGRRMEQRIWRYVPFKAQSLCLIKKEVKTMIWSNAVLIPFIIVIQTLASMFIYWALGFKSYLLLGFFTAVCGLIPVVGTAIVYMPFAIYMLANGQIWEGITLAAYGLLIISNIDNVARIVLLKEIADAHPLIVIFGVILGIALFGFWGIIFGPLMISGFILLIRIYYMEYGLIDPPSEAEMCAPPKKRVPVHFRRIAAKARRK